MYQKLTIVGDGVLNQQGLKRIVTPIEETRNGPCRIV